MPDGEQTQIARLPAAQGFRAGSWLRARRGLVKPIVGLLRLTCCLTSADLEAGNDAA